MKIRVTEQVLRSIINATINEAGVIPKQPGTTPAKPSSAPGSVAGKSGTQVPTATPDAKMKMAGFYDTFSTLMTGGEALDPDIEAVANRVLKDGWRNTFNSLTPNAYNQNSPLNFKFAANVNRGDLNKVLAEIVANALRGLPTDMKGSKFEPKFDAPCVLLTGTTDKVVVFTSPSLAKSAKDTIDGILTVRTAPVYKVLTAEDLVRLKSALNSDLLIESDEFESKERWYYAQEGLVQESVRRNFDKFAASEEVLQANNDINDAIADVSSDEFDDSFLLPMMPATWTKFENENPYSMLHMAYSYFHGVASRHGEAGVVSLALEWAVSNATGSTLQNPDIITAINESRVRRIKTTVARTIMSESEIRTVIRAALSARAKQLKEAAPTGSPGILSRIFLGAEEAPLAGKTFKDARAEGEAIVRRRISGSTGVVANQDDIEKIKTSMGFLVQAAKADPSKLDSLQRLITNLAESATRGLATSLFEDPAIRKIIVNEIMPDASVAEKTALDLLLVVHAGSQDARRFDKPTVSTALAELDKMRKGEPPDLTGISGPPSPYGLIGDSEDIQNALERVSVRIDLATSPGLTRIQGTAGIRNVANRAIVDAFEKYADVTPNFKSVGTIGYDVSAGTFKFTPSPAHQAKLDAARTQKTAAETAVTTARSRAEAADAVVAAAPSGASGTAARAAKVSADADLRRAEEALDVRSKALSVVEGEAEYHNAIVRDLNNGNLTTSVIDTSVSSHVRRAVQDSSVIKNSGSKAFKALNKLGIAEPRTGLKKFFAEAYALSASGKFTDEYYAALSPSTGSYLKKFFYNILPGALNLEKRALTAFLQSKYAFGPNFYKNLAISGDGIIYAADVFKSPAMRQFVKLAGSLLKSAGEERAINNILPIILLGVFYFRDDPVTSGKPTFLELLIESYASYVPLVPTDASGLLSAAAQYAAMEMTSVDESDFAAGLYYLNAGLIKDQIINDFKSRRDQAKVDYFPELYDFFATSKGANIAEITKVLGEAKEFFDKSVGDINAAGEVPQDSEADAVAILNSVAAIAGGQNPEYKKILNATAYRALDEMVMCFTSALTSGSKFKMPKAPGEFAVLQESTKNLIPLSSMSESSSNWLGSALNFILHVDPDYTDNIFAGIMSDPRYGAEKISGSRQARLAALLEFGRQAASQRAPANPETPPSVPTPEEAIQ